MLDTQGELVHLTVMEKIEQRHREKALALLGHPVSERVRELFLSGKMDEHPAVQAAAFYEKNPQ